MHANKLGPSISTKYGNYPVRSNYRFTLSFSPSWIVVVACFLMLAYASAISLPTRFYAALLLTGIGCGPSS
jgi:hypothetical protein